MNRRGTLLALALILVFCFSAVAHASAPSITTSDLTRAAAVSTTTTTTETATEPAKVVVNVVNNTPAVENQIQAIAKFVAENNLPPAEYFGEEVKQQILSLLPEGANLDDFALNELITAQIEGEADQEGNLEVSFDFATVYTADDVLVALVGVFDAQGNVEWIAQNAEVDGETSLVKVQLTKDTLAKVGNTSFALAILSEN